MPLTIGAVRLRSPQEAEQNLATSKCSKRSTAALRERLPRGTAHRHRRQVTALKSHLMAVTRVAEEKKIKATGHFYSTSDCLTSSMSSRSHCSSEHGFVVCGGCRFGTLASESRNKPPDSSYQKVVVGRPLNQVVNIPHIGFMSAICVDSTHAMGLCA